MLFFRGVFATFVLILLLPCPSLFAQNIKYRQYTVEDGLPHNVGYDIHQDSKGYLWFAMDNGLTRFDGVQFETYTQEDGLQSPYVIEIAEGLDNELFISTHKGGLHTLKNGKIEQFEYPIATSSRLLFVPPNDLFSHLHIFNRNTPISLFYQNAGDRNGGFDLWKDPPNRDYAFFKLPHPVEGITGDQQTPFQSIRKRYADAVSHCRGILPHKDGIILSVDGRPYFVNKGLDPVPIFPEIPEDFYLLSGYKLAGGQICWGGINELILAQPDGRIERIKENLPLLDIEMLRVSSKLQAFFIQKGSPKLYQYDLISRQLISLDELLPTDGNLISYIELDNEDNLWVSTEGTGIFCISQNPFSPITQPQNLPNPSITDLVQDINGTIWIGTKRGLGYWDERQRQVVPIALPNNKATQEILNLGLIQNGQAFVTVNWSDSYYLSKNQKPRLIFDRIDLNDPQSEQIMNFSTYRYLIFRKQGDLVINGSFSTVKRNLNNGEMKFLPFLGKTLSPSQRKQRKLFIEDSQERMWMDGDSGIIKWDGDIPSLIRYPTEISTTLCHDIQEGPYGKIWIGTQNGIFITDGSTILPAPIPDHLQRLPATVLLFDQTDRLWIGSSNGLYVQNGQESRAFSTVNGLQANDITCLLQDDKNRIWVGTSSGISLLDPEIVLEPIAPPVLYITEVLVNGELQENLEVLEINQKENIQINYQALVFSNSTSLQYEYRLNPDDEWKPTPNRSFTTQNLASGSYEFAVRSRKANSSWSQVKSQSFEIVPLWWRSWWAILFYVLGGLMLTGLVSYIIIRQARKREAERLRVQQEFNLLEMKALQSQINPHFLFNALNAIQSFILENEIEAASTYLVRFSRLMRMFLESAKNKFIGLNEELDLLRMYIQLEQLCHEGKFDFKMDIDPEIVPHDIEIPTMVLQPFVENAINHGLIYKSGKGLLDIQFKQENQELYCQIQDNGIGRQKSSEIKSNAQKGYRSRGMEITNERIELYNTIQKSRIKVHIEDLFDENGQSLGTRAHVRFPVKYS